MSEPVRISHSREELHDAALRFMRNHYGLPELNDQEARDRWHERLGLLVVFVEEMWRRGTPAQPNSGERE